MNRKDLKELIKPLVRECLEESIKEVVLESGLLSQIISEVIRGVGPSLLENKREVSIHQAQEEQVRYAQVLQQSERKKMTESRKQLLDSIGKTSYNGINVFEGIKETIPNEPGQNSQANPMSGISPHDPGVDISSLFDFNKAKILAQGKKRQK